MPRAYTKSGSVEKYEPSLFSTGTYAFATVSARDDNGNYSITAASGYKKDSNGSYLLATYYGGVPYYAKFSAESYSILVGTTIIETPIGDATYKKTFVITISWKLPSSASITVSGRLVYKVINADTGASSQTKKNFSYTCSTTDGYDTVEVTSDSSKQGREFEGVEWTNTSTSSNTWDITASWTF